jgi:hypothetical protein
VLRCKSGKSSIYFKEIAPPTAKGDYNMLTAAHALDQACDKSLAELKPLTNTAVLYE